jgi:hypothetical protein
MGIWVAVGEMLGVKVSAGGNVLVGVGVIEGVNVKAVVRVDIFIAVGEGLMKDASADVFIQNQPATTARPNISVTPHNPTTNRRRFLDESAGMI